MNQDFRDIATHMRTLGYAPGESPSASEVKNRWKELSRIHHPDAGGEAETFHAITHAFKMLTDAHYRHHFMLDEMKRKRANVGGDLNIRMLLAVDFDDAFFGRNMSISYTVHEFDDNFQPIPLKDGDELMLEHITVRLAANSFAGFETMLPGRGHKKGEDRGDVLVVLQPLPHGKFTARGMDVHTVERIPLDVCLRGGKIEVVTMYGIKKIKVKPGTAPGAELRVKGHGVRTARSDGYQVQGDHCITVDILFPSEKELANEDIWKQLGIDWSPEEREEEGEAELRSSHFSFTTR